MIKTQLQVEQHPLIRQLAELILNHWSEHLHLSPYIIPSELGYVEGRLDGEKLTIENHCYQTTQFRKMHLESAKVGKTLNILHCVMFPNPEYELPIFGCDMVVGRGEVSAAIADLSPVNTDKTLPVNYQQALAQLTPITFTQVRQLPEWGDIFSKYVVFIRPRNSQEIEAFFERIAELLRIHTSLAQQTQPSTKAKQEANLAGQHYYCNKQRQNDKTRRVLEKAFGAKWAETYFNTILFDLPRIQSC
ncbi:phycocyanobilin:ferredoxin oxidoreductase [Gloeocapsa sp. PCC 73106]|uniref:phycocyanobilin:ferredoxin oxidoreductase n=1 Tax=Gloeocapsa sp. PCC 73106 TaxID=102232 RepID=UPI0002AC9266|nr:phycocyanobilin:ferredoxin oxidoreductase [Gloeocapsa sp. PCC 73106]ELR98424.1 phycocyanobilin:ferredoxin oxidoreductase [Gloeocapsa sp. PCC 73106]